LRAGVGNKIKEYKLEAYGYELKRIQGRAWPLPAPVRFYGFPDEVSAFYQNAGFTSDLALALERQLKRILYLGPLRDIPRRSYTWAGDVPEHVGRDGDGAVNALLAAADRRISGGFKQRALPFQHVIASWLEQLGLLDSFETRKITAGRKDYEVRVRTKGSTKDVDLTDVGFGISQVLPVVVESFYVPPNSTVIIEQPELHLHPRVQSELADLFIAAIQAREKGEDRKIQFIIESHSEHFLQRLQRRIAENALQPDDIALYFCEPNQKGSVLRELKVNSFGDIDDWPEDFFGDPMTDISARMKAAAEREVELMSKR
jgi:predicted ATPase